MATCLCSESKIQLTFFNISANIPSVICINASRHQNYERKIELNHLPHKKITDIVFNLYSSVHALCCVTTPAKMRKNLQWSSIQREQTCVLNDLTIKMQYPWLWNHEIIFVTASKKCNYFGFPRQGILFWWSYAGFMHTSGNIMAEMSSIIMRGCMGKWR